MIAAGPARSYTPRRATTPPRRLRARPAGGAPRSALRAAGAQRRLRRAPRAAPGGPQHRRVRPRRLPGVRARGAAAGVVRLRRRAAPRRTVAASPRRRELEKLEATARGVLPVRRGGVHRVPLEPPQPARAPRPPPRGLTARLRGPLRASDRSGPSGRITRAERALARARADRRVVVPSLATRAPECAPVSRPAMRVTCEGCREPWVPWTAEVQRWLRRLGTHGSTASRDQCPQGRRDAPRDGHGVRRADGAHRRRGRRRHDPRRRLGRDGRARLRRHAPGDDRRHGAPRRRGRAHVAERARGRRPAVAQLPRVDRRHRAQRRAARPRRRAAR